jgi:long-chain acyl-CoA synthetase
MIRTYYTDRVLLVTGGTGFLGSALIAKILSDLGEEVRCIYVLIRPRRRRDGGQVAPAQRLEQLFETSLFARLRADPERWKRLRAKVVPVTIDERRADLGLAEDDRRRLLAEVDTIFNNAATVVFDEPLDISIQANVGGPQALLELAQSASRRVDFVHVSTAYVNGQRSGRIDDVELPTDLDMRQIIDAVDGGGFDPEAEVTDGRAFCADVRQEAASAAFVRDLKRDILRRYPRRGRKMTRKRLEGLVADRRDKWITRRLVDEGMRRGKARGWTDVYTYTKAMGEQLLTLRRGDVPLVIVRPSIIESSLSDPEPGWISGLKVMDPLLAAYGRGLIPDFPARPDVVIDVIPVDMVVNGCLAAATQADPARVGVFHIATGDENPVKIGELFDSVRTHYQRSPMTDMGDGPPKLPNWTYPSLRTFRLVFHLKHLYPIRVREWLLNNLPGLKASPRQKRLLRSMRVRLQRVLYYIDIYSPYTHLDCQFQTGRTRALFESLPADERETFSLDVTRIDWKRYIEDIHLPGMRRHVLRDEFAVEAVLPEAPQEPGVEEARLQAEDEVHTIPDLVRSACARNPEAVACEIQTGGGWTSLTYAQLLERVEARAGRWQAMGLVPGDRVVMVGDNGPDWVVNYLAASFLGGAVVPVDPQTPADEVARIAAFTKAAALVAAGHRLDAVHATGDWEGHRLDWATGEPLPRDRPAPGADAIPSPFQEPDIDAQMEASIIFTSGVRVDPRGVILTHANFIADLLGLSEVQRLGVDDRLLSLLPLHHGLEFTGGLLLSLWSGATAIYIDGPPNSRRLLETIRERNITALLAVPRILKILLDRVQRLDGDDAQGPNVAVLKNLRLIVSGGAPLDGDLYDAYARVGLTIHEGYGLTEASPIVSVNPPGDSRRGSVGIPLPGVEVRIDAADGYGDGEILVRGPVVMRGYLERPELTAQVLRGGWLHTGDIGRLAADGHLTITGRRRDLIVTGAGKNVYPAEVEDLYADLPHTAELAVVGLPSARTLGEEVHGVAVLSSRARDLDPDEVADVIRQRVYALSRDLPTYQRIAQMHMWRRPLPRLDDGLVDRAALRAELARGDETAADVDIGDSLAPWERDVYRRVSDLSGLALSEVVAHADAPLDTMINSMMAAELAAGLSQGKGDAHVERLVFDRTNTTLRQLLDSVGPQASAAKPASGAYWSEILGDAMPSCRRRPVLSAVAGRFVRWLRGTRVVGAQGLPDERPYLLAASASAGVSTATLLAALGGYVDGICLVVEREQDLVPGRDSLLCRWLGDRVVLAGHPSLEAGMRAAAVQLGPRRPLLLFPEGQRGVAGRGSGAFKSGIGLLALELGVPIVPLHISEFAGTTRIEVGAAIDPDDFVPRRTQLTSYEVYREIAADVRLRLRDLAQRQETD